MWCDHFHNNLEGLPQLSNIHRNGVHSGLKKIITNHKKFNKWSNWKMVCKKKKKHSMHVIFFNIQKDSENLPEDYNDVKRQRIYI